MEGSPWKNPFCSSQSALGSNTGYVFQAWPMGCSDLKKKYQSTVVLFPGSMTWCQEIKYSLNVFSLLGCGMMTSQRSNFFIITLQIIAPPELAKIKCLHLILLNTESDSITEFNSWNYNARIFKKFDLNTKFPLSLSRNFENHCQKGLDWKLCSFIAVICLTDLKDLGNGPSQSVPVKLQNYFVKQMPKRVDLFCAAAEITMLQARSITNAHVELR